ncbi:MAG: 50S ribosomal protein L4 [Deltaproteobacteria bacterium]|nr:50S ribosomal protein L4 [Deltaproteobacteria bacterium]
MKLPVYSATKTQVGEFEFAPAVVACDPQPGLLFAVVQATRTNHRVGTASTKTRGEVRGSDKKPYRQKGTGRARHGTEKSGIFVGGGVTFGPKPRPFVDRLPPRQRAKAFQQAFAMKLRDGKVIVLDAWHCEGAKTKPMVQLLKQFAITSGLLVIETPNACLSRSVRNIPHVSVREARCLNTYDLLAFETVVISRAALEVIKGRLAA